MTVRTLCSVALVIAATLVWLLGAIAVSSAHPFGEPQTVTISADGNDVRIRWRAPADDLRVLGGAVGALPDRQVVVIEPGEEPSPVGASEAELLSESPELADYLSEHTIVRQNSVACPVTVSLDDILDDGALLEFSCPEVVRTVEIEVTLLLEFHEAYRTAAIGDGSDPETWMYTGSDTVHEWSFAGTIPDEGDDSTDSVGDQPDLALFNAFDNGAALPVALGVAFVVGAGHGLAPGHGKTMAAAYLVGTHARRRHATALAGIVAGMHTASVMALGLAWWLLVDDGPVPLDSITRWGQVAVGIAVVLIGVLITRRQWKRRHHHHLPGHDHGEGHGHHHGPPQGAEPWSRAGLAGIAAAGGLLPSPSAFLVLVGGLLTGRGWFAVAMVAAFGVGLAVTVLGAGLLTLAGRDWLSRRMTGWAESGRAQRVRVLAARIPMLAGVAVIVGGCVMVATPW